MTIKAKNLDWAGGAAAHLKSYLIIGHGTDADEFVEAYTLTGGAATMTLTEADGAYPPQPCSLYYTITDSDTSISAISITTTGEDQFGAPQSETITATTSSHGTKVFAKVSSVVLNSVTGAAAGDTLQVGLQAGATSVLYGLPIPVRKATTDGVGGSDDTVKATYKNGATAAFTVDADQSAITGVTVTAGHVVAAVLRQ